MASIDSVSEQCASGDGVDRTVAADLPQRMASMFDRLWPLNRSLTGAGVRESLDILSEIVPLTRHRFPSGTRVFDWVVPKEWTVRGAYITTPDGRRIADVAEHNLHLMGYSVPVRRTMPLAELKPHLHTLPAQPTAIPYVTSYYRDDWGFCIPYQLYERLEDGDYEVVVDSTLTDGFVEIGEAVLPGDLDDEVLLSSYICHPSMANNELSGPLALAFLYERLRARATRRYTYRFVLNVETIGTICYLHLSGQQLRERCRAGWVLTCVGDRAPFTLKTSRDGQTLADRAARIVLRDRGPHREVAFDAAHGSEERQYCAPGFNLPVASLSRSLYATYPEYHTSLDDRNFISFDSLAESVDVLERMVDAVEENRVWRNTVMFGEPHLERRGLYPHDGTPIAQSELFKSMTWLLNLADGTRDLLAVAERARTPFASLEEAARRLRDAELLVEQARTRDSGDPPARGVEHG